MGVRVPPPASSIAAVSRLPLDRWLSSRDAAAYLGVEASTMAKWRAHGVGPRYSCALGRDPRYLLSDLDEFMLSRMATNTAEAKHLRRARPVDGLP
jgi:hypothetical protein